ncbi:MAG: peptide chain release factor N(5)-glutamine methyltransferase [Bacteroidota bacterium]|nr:peptide chain release factor N(5)-glutamine methyltransferase [Bacteroidota bacterium]
MFSNTTLKFWFDEIRKDLLGEYVENEANQMAKILLEDLSIMRVNEIATSPDLELSFAQIKLIEESLARLLQHEPIQYVTGISEFAGLQFVVNKHVLIPRPETEELINWIKQDFKGSANQNLKCIDLGTGSGIIPITLQYDNPNWDFTAVDLSKDALQVASNNAAKHKANIIFMQEDILGPKQEYGLYDIIISNPPYVTEADKNAMQKNVLDFEPHSALFVTDGDPLQFYKAIIQFAQKHLKTEGFIYCEIHEDYHSQTKDLFEKYYTQVELKQDIHGKYRMIKASI